MAQAVDHTVGFNKKSVPYTILAQAVSGCYELRTPEGQVSVSGDEFFIAPAYAPLHITHRAPPHGRTLSYRYVHFQLCIYETIDIFSLYTLPPKVDAVPGARLSGWIQELLEMKCHPPGIKPAIRRQCLLHQIMSLLLDISTPSAGYHGVLSSEVWAIVEFIREHMADELTIELLLQRFPYSRSALFQLFKTHLHQTPMAYIKSVRLHEA